MNLIAVVAHHGYLATAIVTFLACAGLPLPMSLTLLAAGAASHGRLHLGLLLPIAFAAALSGDVLLYFGGRSTGWWLLTLMCRISLDPEACIFSASSYFYRHGARTLLFAKFLPGLGAVAAPLAGSLKMRLSRFLRLDAAGVLLYLSVWLGAGYLFSPFLRQIAYWLVRAGDAVALLVLALFLGYLALLLLFTLRARRHRKIEKIAASALYQRLQTEDPNRLVIIADVRSHGYYDPGMHRIKNSIRVEPNRLKEELAALREFMVPECEIYLYCSCIRDTTSVRVAHLLQKENLRTRVIQGGLKAWVRAGGALELVPESDLERLPRFD